MEVGTKPVHAPVNCILNCCVPSVIDGQWFGIVDNIAHAMADLESSKVTSISISDSQDQVAGPSC
jgi:hypothetical protein